MTTGAPNLPQTRARRAAMGRAAWVCGVVAALLTTACSRDIDLGDTPPQAGLHDRYEVHRRAASRAAQTCVGAACVQLRAKGAVGPGSAPCLNGGGATCAARIDVRAGGPALPTGATLSLSPTGAAALHLTLRNAAPADLGAALRVLAVWVEERCDGEPCVGPPAFSCTRGPDALPCAVAQQVALVPDAAAVPGARRHEIWLARAAGAAASREAVVRVLVSGDPGLSTAPWRATVRTVTGAPHLQAVHDTVAMPWQGPAVDSLATVDLVNAGDAPAEIYGLALVGSDAFRFQPPGSKQWTKAMAPLAAPWLVPPGTTVHVPVRFTPGDAAKKHASLEVSSNGSLVTTALVGNSSAPCMQISPSKPLALGVLQPGDCAERRLDVHSCGSGVLAVTGVEAVGAGLHAALIDSGVDTAVDATGDAPGDTAKTTTPAVLIAAGGARKLRVRYCPKQPGVLTGHVRVTADGLPPHVVPVSAETVASLCPVAAFAIDEGTDVLPLTTLHLDASDSSAPVPGALTYVWSATPPGANAAAGSVAPAASTWTTSSALTTYKATLAGVHQVCLSVVDAAGHPACETTCTAVTAVPDDLVHVELLWSTPADPDESDVGAGAGSDLDLHFAHPLASGADLDCDGQGDPWFHSTHDAYWANGTPAWGSAAPTAGDDPALLRDDTDGAGPEVIALPTPELSAAPYQLAVHYWNDHGFGTAHARVRVHVNGTLAASFGPQPMQPLDLWTVASLSFSAAGPGTVAQGAVSPTLSACWQQSPACGDQWALAGSACVTPCYLPTVPPATSHAPACAALP